MNKPIDTVEALSIAVFAFEQNNKKVVKDTSIQKGTDGLEIKQFSNKSYLLSQLDNKFTGTAMYPTGVNITDAHRQTAVDIKTWFGHSHLMAVLSKGQVSDFHDKLYGIVSEDTVRSRNFGLLCWAPKLHHDGLIHEQSRETSARYEMTSKPIGKIGAKIEIDLEVIEKRYVRHLNVWSVYGHNGTGNLVQFLTKHERLCVSQRITARIKDVGRSPYHNEAFVTDLNFVKAV